jgi:Arc/MetJ-type ribon-helix-helix transcriptional regulator
MPTSTKSNTTIRLSEDDRKEIEEKMKAYGFDQLSPFIRFAVKQLRNAKR